MNTLQTPLLQKGLLLTFVITSLIIVSGFTGRSGFENPCEPEETDCVILSQKDFAPSGGGTFNIEWPGPPRRKLQYPGDLKFYRVNLVIDRNAPQRFSRDFLIQEDRWYGWDTLGRFTATWNAGTRRAVISYPSQCCNATTAPTGTPNPLVGDTFWMGCTKKGNTKANGAKGNDNEASIRLEKVNKSDGIGVKGKFSPLHTVKCLDGVN